MQKHPVLSDDSFLKCSQANIVIIYSSVSEDTVEKCNEIIPSAINSVQYPKITDRSHFDFFLITLLIALLVLNLFHLILLPLLK